MSENVQDATLQVLIRIQNDIASFRKSVDDKFDSITARMDQLETLGRKQRRDVAGILVMMKATAGDFSERVDAIEERVAALESRRS
jgi:phage-related minor tail protein